MELAVGLSVGLGLPVLLLLVGLYYYRQHKLRRNKVMQEQIVVEQAEKKTAIKQQLKTEQEKNVLQKQLVELQDSMQSMMEVRTPWKGTPDNSTAVLARPRGSKIIATTAEVPAPMVRWYWQEDAHTIAKHNKFMVKQPGNWVEYAGSVAAELEQHFKDWNLTGGTPKLSTDLAERISTTGNEQKAENSHTGTKYTVNVQLMVQTNDQSCFSRKMLRDVMQRSESELIEGDDIASISTIELMEIEGDDTASISTTESMDDLSMELVGSAGDITPMDWSVENMLPLVRGQLIQVGIRRCRGWHRDARTSALPLLPCGPH